MVSWWSEPQLSPGLVSSTSIQLPHLWLQIYNQFLCILNTDFSIDHLVMSMCRVISCVVEKVHLLWTVHSLGRILLAFALLYFVLQGQTWLLHQVFLNFLLLHPNPLWWIGHFFFFFGVSSSLLGLNTTGQLQLLWHWWLWHRLGLL